MMAQKHQAINLVKKCMIVYYSYLILKKHIKWLKYKKRKNKPKKHSKIKCHIITIAIVTTIIITIIIVIIITIITTTIIIITTTIIILILILVKNNSLRNKHKNR